MSAVLVGYDAFAPALNKLKEEFERKKFFGKTRQEYEWQKLHIADKKLLLTLAGVASLDSVEALAVKNYKELTPPERGAIASAHRSLRRVIENSQSLGAMGAGVV